MESYASTLLHMKLQLITVEKADRKNVNALSLQPVIFLKRLHIRLRTGDDCIAPTHFTLSQPIHGARSGHKKALLTWRTLTY